MIYPDKLKKGDAVMLVAPARKVSEQELAPAIREIESWGLNVWKGRHLFSEDHQFSGTDRERAEDMQMALDDPEVKAIFCVRGGYGSVRIIDKLTFQPFLRKPKWIVGYSDVCVLHSHLHQLGCASMHSTMPLNFGNDIESVRALRNALFDGLDQYAFNLDGKLFRTGMGEGGLVGGNLSILYALNGSVSDLDLHGKILFLEDVDEYLYHIDRMMMCLKRAGKLRNLAGLVVGGFTEMKDNQIPFGKQAEEIIMEIVKEYDFPVFTGFPAGHTKKNLPLILGSQVQMVVEKSQCRLKFIR